MPDYIPRVLSTQGGREGEDCAGFGILIGRLIVGVTCVAFDPLKGLPFRGGGRAHLLYPVSLEYRALLPLCRSNSSLAVKADVLMCRGEV